MLPVAYAIATAVSFQINGTVYACSNSDPTQCQYSTSASIMPAVIGAVISTDSTQLQFTGTSFFLSGYSASAAYAGI